MKCVSALLGENAKFFIVTVVDAYIQHRTFNS